MQSRRANPLLSALVVMVVVQVAIATAGHWATKDQG
jgi:hypothetical protein